MTDGELLGRFRGRELLHREWDHRAHVRVALLYLREYEFEEALDHLRADIKELNASHGVVEGPTMGYNETTTRAFLQVIAATDAAYDRTFPAQTSEEFCEIHPQLMSAKLLRLYYSPERRMLPEAKATFVEPDLAPLPKIEKR